jgi:hypothetical protein
MLDCVAWRGERLQTWVSGGEEIGDGPLYGLFGEVEDPRALNRRHDFLEVVFVALAAMLCGAEDCTDMAAFARAKLASLREVVALQHGPPSHDTFSRIFRLLAPEPFEAAFAKFTAAFAGALEGGGDRRRGAARRL